MARKLRVLVGALILFSAIEGRGQTRSGHVIHIRFLNPTAFEVADIRSPEIDSISLRTSKASNVSTIAWDRPIPDKKITVELETTVRNQRLTDVFLHAACGGRSIRIGFTAEDLNIPGHEAAGAVRMHYHPDDLKEQAEPLRIAYTVTDVI